ncbi:hypothetical protein JCM16303_001665 [Sporobolomyces ruberrimus]
MSSYPPPPPSPSLRRRFSSSFLPTPGSSLTLKDASTDQVYLSPSVYTPRSSHFVEVPIVQPTRPGGDSDRARVLQVPLTPSRRVIGGSTRFGPGASELEVTLDGDQGGEVKESPGWRAKLRIWFIYRGPQWVSTGVWVAIQLIVFALGIVKYLLAPNFSTARHHFGATFVIARSAALVLHVDVAFVLLPICRGFVSRLRRTRLNEYVPFEKNVEFHKLVAFSLVFWTLAHTVAHLVNFWFLAILLTPASTISKRILSYMTINLTTGPGATGWIMVLLLATLCLYASEKRRKRRFERFQWTHLLFVPFFGCWQLHGMFCMIKPNQPPYCSWKSIGVFWQFILASLLLFLTERLAREYRSRQRTWITRVVQHPSNVVEVQFKKEKTEVRAGQYVLVCCPEVSLTEWHPFSITSAPEEGFVSVHIRVVGDFTRAFAEVLGCQTTRDNFRHSISDLNETGARIIPISSSRVLPRIMVDGPFGSASEDVLKYEVSILIAGGIGVTPFASVLKHIWYRLNAPSQGESTRLRKVYFFWICRDFTSFEWFQTLLLALEAQDISGLIEIHTYLTSPLELDQVNNIVTHSVSSPTDAITRLRAPTHYGRPNFPKLFDRIARDQKRVKDAGVFFCGPKAMGTDLEIVCKKASRSGQDGLRFHWRKENF